MEKLLIVFCLHIAAALSQEGDITCTVPPVEMYQDAVLKCNFPEDLNATKRDFSVYYYPDDKGDAVVDCWWLKGDMTCSARPEILYERTVGRTFTITLLNVSSTQTGRYACQIANYDQNLIRSCQLTILSGKENTCSLTREKSESSATLTCYFTEDIAKTQLNFTVYRHSGLVKQNVIHCWWVEGLNCCQFTDGYLNISKVSANYTVLISEVTKANEVSYSCWHSGSDTVQEKTCSLNALDKVHEEGISTLVIVLMSALSVAIVAAVILFLRYRRKFFSSSKRNAEDHEESTPMIKTPFMEKEEEERTKVTEDLQDYLEKAVKDMYPDMTGTFYFVPPVYFNKTRYRSKHVGEEVIWVPDSSTENDLRHDRAMQHVMHCLCHLAEHGQEKMFVLTQFTFDAYLNNVGTNYVKHLLPTADSSNSKSADLLIINQKQGVLVGVVKTVSDDDVRGESNQEKVDEMVISQVKEGIQQLEEAVCTMNHLTSNLTGVKLRKVLMIPRLPRSSLIRAVASQPDQFANCSDIEMSLCADDLSDSNAPWDIRSDQLDKLVQWWNKVMEKTSDNPDMTEELYLRLISRFCGPATQLSLQTQDDAFLLPKTLAEAVSVTGDLYNRLTLSQDMVDLLLREKRLLLIGPPNTGKTRMLTLSGKKWIKSCHELHVFYGSTVPCESLLHAFREDLRPASAINENATYSPRGASIKHLNFDKEQAIEEALKNLIEMKREQNVYVVADEVDVDGKYFRKFCESLKSKCPDVHLWATGSKLKAAIDGWQVKTFTRPPNCPPAVVRECSLPKANYCIPDNKSEQADNLYPTDGPPVKCIYHKKDGIITTHDCMECGKEVAKFLTKHLIKRNDENIAEDDILSGPSTTSDTKVKLDKRFSILQDKDVLVLFESGMKQGEKFIEGLKESGIGVDTFSAKNDKDIIKEKTGSACAIHVDQLYKYKPRRKIVVYIEGNVEPSDLSLKWRAMTSCTSQLIVVRRNR